MHKFRREITESRRAHPAHFGAICYSTFTSQRSKLWRETTDSCDGRGSSDYGGKRTRVANCGGKTPSAGGIRWIWNSFVDIWLAKPLVTCDKKWHLYVSSPTIIEPVTYIALLHTFRKNRFSLKCVYGKRLKLCCICEQIILMYCCFFQILSHSSCYSWQSDTYWRCNSKLFPVPWGGCSSSEIPNLEILFTSG